MLNIISTKDEGALHPHDSFELLVISGDSTITIHDEVITTKTRRINNTLILHHVGRLTRIIGVALSMECSDKGKVMERYPFGFGGIETWTWHYLSLPSWRMSSLHRYYLSDEIDVSSCSVA